jgi:hypothetical protein
MKSSVTAGVRSGSPIRFLSQRAVSLQVCVSSCTCLQLTALVRHLIAPVFACTNAFNDAVRACSVHELCHSNSLTSPVVVSRRGCAAGVLQRGASAPGRAVPDARAAAGTAAQPAANAWCVLPQRKWPSAVTCRLTCTLCWTTHRRHVSRKGRADDYMHWAGALTRG